MTWKQEELDKELTWEEFKKYLANLDAWISKRPRTLRSWLYSVEAWAIGDH